MKPVVLMHSCSVWPTSVDFNTFRCYLDGYSVEETVERFMTETSTSHTRDDAPNQPLRHANGRASPPPSPTSSGTHGVQPKSPLETRSTVVPAPRPLQREDPRALGQVSEDSDTVLSSVPLGNTPAGEETPVCSTAAGTSQHTTTVATEVSTGRPHRHTTDSRRPSRKTPRKHTAPTHHHHDAHPTGSESASPMHARTRPRKPKSFFLNEDYLDFQRRLLQVEGGPQSYAAALKSQLLFDEVAEQYQLFSLLTAEEYVGRPYSFLTNTYLPFPVEERLRLVRAYYPTDEVVCRLLFGDRMSKLPSEWTDPGALAGSGSGLSQARGPLQRMAGALLAPFRSTGRTDQPIGGHTGPLSINAPGQAAPSASGAGGTQTASGLEPLSHGGGVDHSIGVAAWSEEEQAKLDLIALAMIPAVSLRRQWENIKNVGTSLGSMYRGKAGVFIPRDVPLRTAVEQCYALEGELATSYATMTFGLEHRLTTKLFKRLHTFAEYETICTIIGSVWCDTSMLLLDEGFIEGCRRIARLLDETRVVAELHTLTFGEAMRPRWQMQLDEVQRVISTNSAPDKGLARVSTSPGVTAAVPIPNASASSGTPSHVTTNPAGAATASVPSPWSAAPSFPPTSGHDVHGFAGTSGTFSPTSGPPTLAGSVQLQAAVLGGGSSGTVGGAGGGGGGVPSAPVSANKLFSRRLLLEFPGIMKNLSRVASQLGVSESVSDALDIFFHRIYTYLETVSSRAAPGLASLMLQQQQHRSAVLSTTAGAHGEEETPLAVGSPASSLSPPHSRSLRRAVSSIIAVPASPSSPLTAGASCASAPSTAATTTNGATASTVAAGTLSPPPPPLPTALVNTSVMQPAAVLFAQPLPSASSPTVATQAALSRVTSHVSVPDAAAAAGGGPAGSASGAVPVRPAGALESTAAGRQLRASMTWTSEDGGAAVSTGAPSASAVEAAVLQVLDKRLLRELCQLLNTLPKAWLTLSSLSAEDHATCDAPFNRLAMALKAVSQTLMATDDFH